jgi:hypothetical protein
LETLLQDYEKQTVENVTNYALWCGTTRQNDKSNRMTGVRMAKGKTLSQGWCKNAAGPKYILQCHYDFYYWQTEDEKSQADRKT